MATLGCKETSVPRLIKGSDQALELLELAVRPARDLDGEAEDDLKRVAEVSKQDFSDLGLFTGVQRASHHQLHFEPLKRMLEKLDLVERHSSHGGDLAVITEVGEQVFAIGKHQAIAAATMDALDDGQATSAGARFRKFAVVTDFVSDEGRDEVVQIC